MKQSIACNIQRHRHSEYVNKASLFSPISLLLFIYIIVYVCVCVCAHLQRFYPFFLQKEKTVYYKVT